MTLTWRTTRASPRSTLVLTTSGSLIATDAKIDIDDNALYRHPELAAYKEESEDDPVEAEAHRRGLQFVRLKATSASSATAPAW